MIHLKNTKQKRTETVDVIYSKLTSFDFITHSRYENQAYLSTIDDLE